VVVGDQLRAEADRLRPERVETAAGATESALTTPAALRLVGVEHPARTALVVVLRVEVGRPRRPERVETAAGAMESAVTKPAAHRLVGVERPPCTALVEAQRLHQALVGVAIPGMAVVPIRNCAAPSGDGVARPPPIAVGAIFATPTRLW
jgi:hypothetical protein